MSGRTEKFVTTLIVPLDPGRTEEEAVLSTPASDGFIGESSTSMGPEAEADNLPEERSLTDHCMRAFLEYLLGLVIATN